MLISVPKYTIQKAVSPDKVKKAHKRSLAGYARDFEAQLKYDGCCNVMHLATNGSYHNESRTGEKYVSMDGVASDAASALKLAITNSEGLVIIGEAWWRGKGQFNLISGEYRRGQVSDKLQFMLNDVLTAAEFDAGFSAVRYQYRMQRLAGCNLPENMHVVRRYTPGNYGDPQSLCNQLVEQGGYDGLILRDPKGTWTAGRGTTGEIVKIKRVLSYDLTVTDIKEGEGKHVGRMGAICVDFQGKPLWVGTGFTDKQREEIWQSPTKGLGLIAEIEAMDISSEGVLREPRFKGFRFDKIEPDTL